MLDKEFKKQWVAALRSGDYDQGKGALCKFTSEGAKYCCLGVAFEEMYGEDAWVNEIAGRLSAGEGGSRGVWYPPGLGYDEVDKQGNWCGHLMVMNDNGETFDEIADYIEENL